jgi:hypothetical protein
MNGSQDVTTPIIPTSFFGNIQVIQVVLIKPNKATITLDKTRMEVDWTKNFDELSEAQSFRAEAIFRVMKDFSCVILAISYLIKPKSIYGKIPFSHTPGEWSGCRQN